MGPPAGRMTDEAIPPPPPAVYDPGPVRLADPSTARPQTEAKPGERCPPASNRCSRSMTWPAPEMLSPPRGADAIRRQGSQARHQDRQDATVEARDDPPMDREGRPPMIQAATCLDTALELLHCFNLWPVAIKPGEKAPIGESWGSTRPTERSIRETFKRFPKAGVGLLLGPEAGIIDIECDGPEGEDSLAKLMGGEIVMTLGWSSARGPHHVFRYDARLARYGKSIIKLPELPGLEIRIGGNGKQLQSNCPPTIGSDGKPREWNGNWIVADLPEAVFTFLDAALAKPKRKPGIVAPILTRAVTSARDAYATKALDEECQAVALAADGEQNETLNTAAFNLGQLVGAGVLDRPEVERRLLEAAAGYVQKDGEAQARATIQSGLNAGQNQPRDLSHLEANRNGRHDPGKGESRPARRPGRPCDSPSRLGRGRSRWMSSPWPCNASVGSWPKRPADPWSSWRMGTTLGDQWVPPERLRRGLFDHSRDQASSPAGRATAS